MDLAKTTLRLLTVLVLTNSGATALAKSPAEEVQDVRSEFLSEAVKARAEYRRELQKAAKSAVRDYERAAASAVRAGELAAATDAMRQILWLDRDHKKARAHFEAIGQLDEVLKELEDEPVIPEGDEPVDNSKLARELVGTTWTWGAKDTITFAPGGVATVSSDKQPNSRAWRVLPDGMVHVMSLKPLNSYVLVKFDPKSSTYLGKAYLLEYPDFNGKRTR